MVSRQEYFNLVNFGMQTATRSIKGSVTGSSPATADERDHVQVIIEQIRRAKARNVTVQYLLPMSQDKIAIASKYREAGAEIRFHPGLLVNDIRFVTIDSKYSVLGLPGAAGQNEPTREGYAIPSEGLAQILLQQFEGNWVKAVEYEDYLRDVLLEIKSHNPRVSCHLLSSQFEVAKFEVNKVLATAQTSSQRQA